MYDQAEKLREMVKENQESILGTRVIAVTSGKGGVGKTNLAVNLGIALSQKGNRTLLVDADLGLANVDVLTGLIPKYHLGHVISGVKAMNEIVLTGPAGLRIIAGGSGDYRLANLNERNLEICLQHINDIEKITDIMIVDTGAGISRSVLKFVLAAEEVVVVTTPEPTAITDAYGVIKVIASSTQHTSILLIVNMVKNDKEGEEVVRKLTTVSEKFLGITVKCLGFVPHDQVVSKAVKEQQPFTIIHPRSQAAHGVQKIAEKLVDQEAESKKEGIGSFFNKLLRIGK